MVEDATESEDAHDSCACLQTAGYGNLVSRVRNAAVKVLTAADEGPPSTPV